MYQRAFAVVSDDRFFPGLWALLNSIGAYYGAEYRVFVFGHRLSGPAVAAVRQHPLGAALTLVDTAELAYPPAGAWEAKQCVPSHLCGKVRALCLLDADLVLLSRVDDAFERAEAGRIVSSRDGTDDVTFDAAYRSFGAAVPGSRQPYFNSGFLCLDLVRHWDLAALWEFAGRFAGYSPGGGKPYSFAGHGDQGALNAVAALLNKVPQLDTLPQEVWCNSAGWSADETVDLVRRDGPAVEARHRRTGERQRVLHSTGPKWWAREGQDYFRTSGDVLACFRHFAALHPPPLPVPAESGGAAVPAGVLRYVGDVSRQDAQVLAEHAAAAPRILEFGVGASTQILAQTAPPGASVVSVETDPHWVRITRENLERFGCPDVVRFALYPDWCAEEPGVIDLAFVDGVDHLRWDFAERAWGALRVGGALLVHDTRRRTDAGRVMEFVARHHLEVDRVLVNTRASNITVIQKKVAEPYVNWNAVEALNAADSR